MTVENISVKANQLFKNAMKFILFACFSISFIPTVSAYSNSGYCGSAYWEYSDGVLTIRASGEGIISDYDSANTPWYYQRTSISKIVLEDGISVIGKEAFSGMYISSIYIPPTVTKIDVGAFYNCNQLSSVSGGDSVSYIGSSAFSNTKWYNDCKGLTILGNTVLKYGGNMPDNTEIILPDNIKSISSQAFYECSGLKSIELPNGIESIGKNSFRECTSLNEICLPESVIEVGDDAFRACSTLTEVYLPSIISSIGRRAFYNCTNLKKIYVLSDNCTLIEENTIPKTATIYGFENSTAEQYATKYNKSFKKLCNDNMPVEITSVTQSGDINEILNVTFNPHNTMASNKKIILALYDNNGRFLHLDSKESSELSGDIQFIVDEPYNSYKIFIWDSINELFPISKTFSSK